MKKLILIISVIILIAAGFFVYKYYFTEEQIITNQTEVVNNSTNQVNTNQTYPAQDNCDKLDKQVISLREEINYCQEDADCQISINIGSPFCCYLLHNKEADLGEIERVTEEYNQVCLIIACDCMEPPVTEDVKCIDLKCVDTRFDI